MLFRSVISVWDADTIYKIPQMLHDQGLDRIICDKLDLHPQDADLSMWARLVAVQENPKKEVNIAMVGKYVDLTESTRGEESADGMHLSPVGLSKVGQAVARSLGLPEPLHLQAELRTAIVEKNRLWADCWRPANWSFVYGDRISQNYGKGFGPVPSLRRTSRLISRSCPPGISISRPWPVVRRPSRRRRRPVQP